MKKIFALVLVATLFLATEMNGILLIRASVWLLKYVVEMCCQNVLSNLVLDIRYLKLYIVIRRNSIIQKDGEECMKKFTMWLVLALMLR